MARNTSIWISEDVEEALEYFMQTWGSDKPGRGKQSWALGQAILRIYAQYKIDRQKLWELFNAEERNVMSYTARRKYTPESIPGAVLADVQDAAAAVFYEYQVDKNILIQKLKALSTGEQFALVAWLERSRV
jgi:hypothetical protein